MFELIAQTILCPVLIGRDLQLAAWLRLVEQAQAGEIRLYSSATRQASASRSWQRKRGKLRLHRVSPPFSHPKSHIRDCLTRLDGLTLAPIGMAAATAGSMATLRRNLLPRLEETLDAEIKIETFDWNWREFHTQVMPVHAPTTSPKRREVPAA